MDFDDKFLPERFTDPIFSREWMLADRKREIYPIWEDRLKLADFIADFIALANMSYRYGKVARLLFGINDDRSLVTTEDGTPTGVQWQSTKKEYLQELNYENETQVDELFKRILLDFRSAIRKYVRPVDSKGDLKVELDIKTGWVEDYFLAYLEIGAQTVNTEPYCVSKEIVYKDSKGITHNFHPGDAWYREHEHNEKMKPELFSVWYSANDCPVISGSKWKAYFDELQKEEFDQATKLSGYQEPQVGKARLLSMTVREFMESDNSLLVISGQAGMGKSVFLRRLVCELAGDAKSYIKDLPDDIPPSCWLPIYRELRLERFRTDTDLSLKILSWWNQKMKLSGLTSRATKLFLRQDAKWLICLDALDEMDRSYINNFVIQLEEFQTSYPNIKVLITTRPDTVDPFWEQKGFVLSVRELSNDEIFSFLESTIQGDESADDLIAAKQLLEKELELLKLVRTPLYLYAFANTFAKDPIPKSEIPDLLQEENASEVKLKRPTAIKGEFSKDDVLQKLPELEYSEIQPEEPDYGEFVPLSERNQGQPDGNHIDDDPHSLSRVLKKMIDVVWQHDNKHFQEKKYGASTELPIIRLRKLAAKVDGINRCDLDNGQKQIGGKKVLGRFLSLGFLEMENSWLKFRSRVVQCYLAASHLDYILRSNANAEKEVKRLVSEPDSFWISVFSLYKEIAYDDESIDLVSNLIESS